MAERQVVQDPLASDARSNSAVRQLGLGGVSNPRQSGGTDWIDNQMAIQAAFGKLASTLGKAQDAKNDEQITEGQLAYMTGTTEAEIYKSGNKYSQQGWQSLNSATQANDFILSETQRLKDGDYKLDPNEYNKQLMARRGELLKTLPDDPAVRKMFVTQFDSTATKLVAEQTVAHNEYNAGKTVFEFSNLLEGNPKTDPNAHRVMPGGDLKVSPGIVSRPAKVSAYDRDVGIRTLLGEAGMEGEVGMAAVAHNMKNRLATGRWGDSIASVALAEKQYSTWNAGPGGNGPEKYSVEGAAYQRAAKVFDAVMGGHVQDMTGGYLNYFSPRGMDKLVADGDQKNLLPKGYKGGGTKLGGHVFWGEVAKGNGATMTTAMSGANGGDLIVPPGSDPASVKYELGIGAGPDRPPSSASYDILMNSDMLPPEQRAAVAADLMIKNLARGDDSLYTELGGLASLQALGLDVESISKVEAAYHKYKEKSAGEFNVANETRLDELMQRVKRGEATPAEAGKELSDMTDEGWLTEAQARSEQQKYFDASRAGDDKFIESPELQLEVANIQIALNAGAPIEDAIAQAKKLATKYGIPEKKMETTIGALVDIAKNRVIANNKKIEENAEKYRKNQIQGRKAAAALANGYGISDLRGSIDRTLPDGTEETVDLAQFAIDQLKQSVMEEAKAKVAYKAMDEAQAATWADREVNFRLKNQRVVDVSQRQAITAALSGGFVTQDGKLTEDSKQAMDWYQTMVADPRIGAIYASQYIDSEEAKVFALTTSEYLKDGFDMEEAMYKAHAKLTTAPPQGASAVETSFIARQMVKDRVDETMDLITEDVSGSMRGWTNWVFGTETLPPEQRTALASQKEVVSSEIERRAQRLKSVNPMIPESAAVEGAVQETARDAVHLGGQIVFDKSPAGKDLSQEMGFNGDKMLPNDAMNYYIEKNYASFFEGKLGSSVLETQQEQWYESGGRVAGGLVDLAQASVYASAAVLTAGKTLDDAYDNFQAFKKNVAPKLGHYTTVDMRSGIVTINFYRTKDAKNVFSVASKLSEIGAEYRDDKLNQPTIFGRVSQSMRNAVAPMGGTVEDVPALGDWNTGQQ